MPLIDKRCIDQHSIFVSPVKRKGVKPYRKGTELSVNVVSLAENSNVLITMELVQLDNSARIAGHQFSSALKCNCGRSLYITKKQ